MDTTVSSGVRRCAVIYNPTKVSDEFRGLVTDALTADSWADTLWLETTESDPGRAMTKQAVGASVDLVIGAGGGRHHSSDRRRSGAHRNSKDWYRPGRATCWPGTSSSRSTRPRRWRSLSAVSRSRST